MALRKFNKKGEIIGEVTPEEEQAQKAAGQQYIQEREKIATQLIAQGSSATGAQRTAAQQISQKTEALNPQTQEFAIQRELDRQAVANQVTPVIQQTTPTQVLPTPQNVAQNALQPQIDKNGLPIQPSELVNQGSIPNVLARTLGGIDTEVNPQKGIGGLATAVIKPLAQVWDFAQSLFSGGKGVAQKEAEATWADAKANINMNIALIKDGLADPQEVLNMIELSDRINNRLEQSAKSWSGKNLRYFLTDGVDVQTQVILNRNQVAAWRLRVAQEQQNAMINQAKLSLGVTQ